MLCCCLGYSHIKESTLKKERKEYLLTKIGYARVSSEDQNLARQIKILHKYGVDDEYIFKEKVSGATIEGRPELQKMLKFVRKGDVLVIAALDRLGRNANDISRIIQMLKDKGVALQTPELPDFSAIPDDNVRNMVTDLMVTVFKWQAQMERQKIKERQNQGIVIAKKKGIYKGGKLKYSANAKDPKNRLIWETVVKMLDDGHSSISEIARKVGISRQQVYRIKRRL